MRIYTAKLFGSLRILRSFDLYTKNKQHKNENETHNTNARTFFRSPHMHIGWFCGPIGW